MRLCERVKERARERERGREGGREKLTKEHAERQQRTILQVDLRCLRVTQRHIDRVRDGVGWGGSDRERLSEHSVALPALVSN